MQSTGENTKKINVSIFKHRGYFQAKEVMWSEFFLIKPKVTERNENTAEIVLMVVYSKGLETQSIIPLFHLV